MKKDFIYLLEDLRKCIMIYFISFISIFLCCFLKKDCLYKTIAFPLKNSPISINDLFIYTNILEAFFSDLTISLYFSIFFSIPIIFFCVYKFISPSLYKNEKNIAIKFIICSILLFYLSSAFMYFIIFPRAIHFLVLQQHYIAKPMLKIGEYIQTFFSFMFVFAISGQTPLVLVILAKLNIISQKSLTKHRKFIIVTIFILSAIITPPDIISQIICASIFILIYEITIFFIKKRIFVKNKITKKKKININNKR